MWQGSGGQESLLQGFWKDFVFRLHTVIGPAFKPFLESSVTVQAGEVSSF